MKMANLWRKVPKSPVSLQATVGYKIFFLFSDIFILYLTFDLQIFEKIIAILSIIKNY